MNGNFVYRRAAAVTPADGTDLPGGACQGLLVTAAGTVSLVMELGGQVDLTAVAANTILPLRVARVRATGTAATVVALY